MDILEKLCFILLPVLVAALLTSIISRKLKERQAFNEAGNKLREAFAPEILKVKISINEGTYQTPNILNSAFEKHYMAVNEFAFFLNPKEHIAFTKAWEEYASRNSNEEKRFEKYLVLPDEAVEKIYAILDFTKN